MYDCWYADHFHWYRYNKLLQWFLLCFEAHLCKTILAFVPYLSITKSQLPASRQTFQFVCAFQPHCWTCTQPLDCIMSLSMVVNWAQRQLVSMKAPVLSWQKQKRKSSLEKAALCREANGAELLPCSLAAIDLWFSCSATPTAAHTLPLPCPEINVKVRKWSQHSTFLVRTYFPMYYFDVNGCLLKFSTMCRNCYVAHRQAIPDINMSCYILLLASLRVYHHCSLFHHWRCTVEWSCKV